MASLADESSAATYAMLWDKACPGQPRSFNFPEIIAVGALR